MISLATLSKQPDSPLTQKELDKLKEWLDEDWESHDISREVIVVIKRLLLTIPNLNKEKTPRVVKVGRPKELKAKCHECGCTIAYTKKDIKCYSGTDYSGGPDGQEWVNCPNCREEITLRSW
jgi:hypothetical protein